MHVVITSLSLWYTEKLFCRHTCHAGRRDACLRSRPQSAQTDEPRKWSPFVEERYC